MGWGDNIMATGMAKAARGGDKRVAFGDGHKIMWDHHSESIFRFNPLIAPPGSERAGNLTWVPFYRGHRIYNQHDQANDRWVWNYEFKAAPGELYFDAQEKQFEESIPPGFVLVEPNYHPAKLGVQNKDWGFQRYQLLVNRLRAEGRTVRQFSYGFRILAGVEPIRTPSIRHALAALGRAALYVGPEGGLHHGAAARGISAVVLFGGFIPPAITGYDFHTNITGNISGNTFCGSLRPCDHCKAAMRSISVDDVHLAVLRLLNGPR